MSTVQHLTITVSGKVQGVFFRASTKQKADELGIRGFVRNERDGSVYIEAEATPDALTQFAAWCQYGPPLAEVQSVTRIEGSVVGYSEFEVRR